MSLMLNAVKYLEERIRKCCGVVKSPEVRLTHGGTAEKHGFFSQSDFRTKIAILPYI
jgi:hypothetical protein